MRLHQNVIPNFLALWYLAYTKKKLYFFYIYTKKLKFFLLSLIKIAAINYFYFINPNCLKKLCLTQIKKTNFLYFIIYIKYMNCIPFWQVYCCYWHSLSKFYLSNRLITYFSKYNCYYSIFILYQGGLFFTPWECQKNSIGGYLVCFFYCIFMRFFTCYLLIIRRGFFVLRSFYFYDKKILFYFLKRSGHPFKKILYFTLWYEQFKQFLDFETLFIDLGINRSILFGNIHLLFFVPNLSFNIYKYFYIRRLFIINSYRGYRLFYGLPARGQRTWSNGAKSRARLRICSYLWS